MARELAAQFLALAEKHGATILLVVGHRLMGSSLLHTGNIAQGRAHYDQSIAFYDPIEHRPLATRFGHDNRVAALAFRSLAHWVLGYPEAANADIQQTLNYAREIGQAATLMVALTCTCWTHIPCGNYGVATRQIEEAVALADEKAAPFWKALGMMNQGWLFALNSKSAHAVHMLTSGIIAYRSTGATLLLPLYLSHLAKAHAELGQFDDAWRSIGEAMTEIATTKDRWQEAEVHRVAGEIALMSPGAGTAEAEAYFERALGIAREQQAKSWELRATMSVARLRRDQGKPQQARDLLAPVYGWFTEGFDTLDLKQAKALLEELTS